MSPRSSWILGLGIGALVIVSTTLAVLTLDYVRLRGEHWDAKQELKDSNEKESNLQERIASLTHMVSTQNDRMRDLATELNQAKAAGTSAAAKPRFEPFSAKAFIGNDYISDVLVGFRRETTGEGPEAQTTYYPIVRVPEAAKRTLMVTQTNYVQAPAPSQPAPQQTSYHYYGYRDPVTWFTPVWFPNNGAPSTPSPGMPAQPSAPQMSPSRLPSTATAPRPHARGNPRGPAQGLERWRRTSDDF